MPRLSARGWECRAQRDCRRPPLTGENTGGLLSSEQEAAHRAQSRDSASNGLDRVRQRAEADKTFRFNNLFHFLKVDLLRASFYELKRTRQHESAA